MRKIFIIVLILLVISAVFAFGFISGYSNLYGPYPSFTSKARKPMRPFSKDSYLNEQYRYEVEQYVKDAKSYVQAAYNDIDTINDEISDAIDAANNVVQEYNSYIQFGF
jgi:hypothetical protein